MSIQSELLDRITVRAEVFGGKPIIRDTRVAVEHVLGMLAAGDTAETILREYPALEPEDIQACLRFAHRSAAGVHVHDRLPDSRVRSPRPITTIVGASRVMSTATQRSRR